MGEREPNGKIIQINKSPIRRHARHFVWPVQSIPRTHDTADEVIAETPVRKSVSVSREMTNTEIPAKEDIFVSSHMK